MDMFFIAILDILFYLSASLFIGLNLIEKIPRGRYWLFLLGFLAVCLHGILLHEWIDIAAGQNLNVFNMLSLTAWLVSIFVLVMILIKSVEILSLFIFPASAISILLVLAFPRVYIVDTIASPDTLFHIILSIFTFCVLCLAGLLAILLAIQEWLLHQNRFTGLIRKLPPLESMETLLFQVITLGFILLSVVLITSVYFYHQLLFVHLIILQKTIIVIAAWIIFAILLIGRFRWGWRGKKAIYYTLLGVMLLIIAYFGSKLMLEAIR